MTNRLFGTDGIRAPFGSAPLDHPTVRAVGFRLGERLREKSTQPTVILGGDTRASTEEICTWLAEGLDLAGAGWRFGGVLPTPAVGYLVKDRQADAGIAVSASHNPLPDNGIKLFARDGSKWSSAEEELLEEGLHPLPELTGSSQVSIAVDSTLAACYFESLLEPRGGLQPLAGLRVVLDTANGAASPFAAEIFRRLGASVTALFDRPDGSNINVDCGSTHPEEMARTVVEKGCDLGVAFDGDADRAILADKDGQVRDGDAMLYLWAQSLAAEGQLEPRKIVATTMSNLGLERALNRHEIDVVRSGVGDRTVVETMHREGIVLGGEQSGHLIHSHLTTTGDGLVTAVEAASILQRAKSPLSDLLTGFRRYPQVLENVRVPRKPPLDTLPRVAATARQIEDRLGDRGRLVLRYSGTEPLARVMIEGSELREIQTMASQLVDAIRQDLGEP